MLQLYQGNVEVFDKYNKTKATTAKPTLYPCEIHKYRPHSSLSSSIYVDWDKPMEKAIFHLCPKIKENINHWIVHVDYPSVFSSVCYNKCENTHLLLITEMQKSTQI